MNVRDLENAVYFLRRVVPGRLDEDRLISTVRALEDEIRKRNNDKQSR